MNNKMNFKLSFDDKSIKIKRYDSRTITTLVSYFSDKTLKKGLEEMGFECIPNVINQIFTRLGYKYDYELNGWSTITTGVTILDSRDADDQEKANRIAITKAKVKAYDRAIRVTRDIADLLIDTSKLFTNTYCELGKYFNDELDALDRVIETGYCNPNKK